MALHEIGHVIGLGHSDNPDDMMSPYYNATKLTLSATDREVAGAVAKAAASAVVIQAAYRGYKTKEERANRESAAVTIQSDFRGYSTRWELSETSGKRQAAEPAAMEDEHLPAWGKQELHGGADLDPEYLGKLSATMVSAILPPALSEAVATSLAAIKIQSVVRGHQARKQLDAVDAPDDKPAAGQRALWFAGNPGSGKTFLGDYLAGRGWHHIDGDQGNQAKEEDLKQRWGKLYQAMTEHQAGKTEISEELWRPYYDFLVQQYKAGLASGKNVVLSFALLGVFGEQAFLRSEIPSLEFVVIEVDAEKLVERCSVRNKAILEKAGTTEEEVWGQGYMADYRKRYGEEYTPERYRQMEVDGAKELVYVKRDPDDTSIVTIKNDDFEDFSSIKELNKLVGLEWEDVDTTKIADINMKRMENLNLDDVYGASEDKPAAETE